MLSRLFIAALLPDALTGVLIKSQRLLTDSAERISLTERDQLHLTLRFIGETGEKETAEIARWIGSLAVPSLDARRFTQSGYGAFPGREGMTLWAGLNIGPEMRRRVAMMETALRTFGCSPETRPWLPHVTLARRAELNRTFGELVPLLPLTSGPLLLGGIVLFKSEFTPGGVRYTQLAKVGGVWP